MFNRSNLQAAKAATVAGLSAVAMAPVSAFAALDLDAAETAILADVATAVGFITTVGLAVLGLIFVAKAIKWGRRAG